MLFNNAKHFYLTRFKYDVEKYVKLTQVQDSLKSRNLKEKNVLLYCIL